MIKQCSTTISIEILAFSHEQKRTQFSLFIFNIMIFFNFLLFQDSSFSRLLVILQHCTTSESDSKRCFIYDKDSDTVSQCEYQEADISGEFLEKMISFRLQANIPICISRDQNGKQHFSLYGLLLSITQYTYGIDECMTFKYINYN